jgi:integrase
VVALFVAFLTVYRRHDPSTGQRTETGKPLAHSFLRQAVAAIGQRHANNGQADPTADATIVVMLEGYGKTYGTAVRGKDPIRAAQLGTICLTLSQPPAHASRDLALCLLATDASLDLGPGQLAGLERSSIFHPERPLEPLVLLVTRRGGPSLHPVEVWPNGLTDICPVTALQALTATTYGAGQNGGKAFGVTLEGVVHLVNDQVRRAGLKPVTVDRRLPRLDTEQRMVLAAAIAQPSDEDKRNRAILTGLYWGCFRGDELAQTRRHHLHLVNQGIEWTLPRAKNDQDGQGQVRGVPSNPDPWICPVTAITDWLERLAHLHGRPLQPEDPVFPGLGRPGTYTTPMTRDAISDVIKTTAERAGLTGDFGSHSPRAGFATDALDDGIPREQVQTYGGWRNHKSLDSYYRRTHIWGTTNPANRLSRLED